MYSPHVLASLALVLATASARRCENITIPLDITSRNGVFNVQLSSNIDAITFLQNLTLVGSNYSQVALAGYRTLTQRVDIAAQYCTPDAGPGATVELLTHGTGAVKNYWDFPTFGGERYSYVDAALAHGHSTLALDRLGCGASSAPDPIQNVQLPAEVAITRAITRLLRTGGIVAGGSSSPPGPQQPATAPRGHRFRRVVHVGHSYGSSVTLTFAHAYPSESDGLVLTGFSGNGSFLPFGLVSLVPELARLAEPVRFAGRAAGYLTWSGVSSLHFVGFAAPFFDPAVLDFTEATKAPLTVGAFLTLGGAAFAAPAFTGPVLVVAGDRDVPVCGGNCFAAAGTGFPNIPAAAAQFFPRSRAFEAYIQPGAGHSLTLHRNATAGYEVIQGFLRRQGLN